MSSMQMGQAVGARQVNSKVHCIAWVLISFACRVLSQHRNSWFAGLPARVHASGVLQPTPTHAVQWPLPMWPALFLAHATWL